MNKKLFNFLSPVILIVICFSFAIIFKDLLSIYVYIPCIMVLYWGLSLLFVHICIKISSIKSFFKKPSGNILWLFIALILGFIPIMTLIDNIALINSPLTVVIIIVFALTNAFFEEMFWRGFVLNYIFSSKIISYIYSLILFTISHFVWAITSFAVRNIYTIIALIIFAAVWNIIRFKTKSIWWSIVSHFLVNFFSLSALAMVNIYIPSAGLLW